MDVKQFRRRMYSHEIVEIKTQFQRMAWKDYQEARINSELSKDYCQFNCDGTCSEYRLRAKRYGKKSLNGIIQKHKGCCAECANSHGYHPYIPSDMVEYFAQRFDEKDGYHTPNGCALPRELRSHTCTYYTCSHVSDNLNHVDKYHLQELEKASRRFRKAIRRDYS